MSSHFATILNLNVTTKNLELLLYISLPMGMTKRPFFQSCTIYLQIFPLTPLLEVFFTELDVLGIKVMVSLITNGVIISMLGLRFGVCQKVNLQVENSLGLIIGLTLSCQQQIGSSVLLGQIKYAPLAACKALPRCDSDHTLLIRDSRLN